MFEAFLILPETSALLYLSGGAPLGLCVGTLATITTGATITSVLLGAPGSASSQAAVIDGFPMAKKAMPRGRCRRGFRRR